MILTNMIEVDDSLIDSSASSHDELSKFLTPYIRKYFQINTSHEPKKIHASIKFVNLQTLYRDLNQSTKP